MNRFDWFKLTSSGILLPTLEPIRRVWGMNWSPSVWLATPNEWPKLVSIEPSVQFYLSG